MKPSSLRSFCIILLCLLSFLPLAAEIREGADQAAPVIASYLAKLPLQVGQVYTLSDTETFNIIDLAAKAHINVFELLDCAYRYTKPQGKRIAMTGDSMRKLQETYDLGQERVLALLPVDKMSKLESGASFSNDQTALDVFLAAPHQAYIEIGTAIYEKHFGFARIEPLLFAEPYGITVKKLIFSVQLEKLELYAPGKGAIYAKGFSKPKKWNLWVITKK